MNVDNVGPAEGCLKKRTKDVCLLVLLQVCLNIEYYVKSNNNKIIQFTFPGIRRATNGTRIKTTCVITYFQFYILK